MRIRVVLKSLLFAYALTGVLLLLLAFALFSFDLGETVVDVGITAVYVLACFMGGFMAGRILHRDKYLWGVGTGAAYYLLLLLVSFAVRGHWDMSITHAVTCIFYVCRRRNTGWNAVVKKNFQNDENLWYTMPRI